MRARCLSPITMDGSIAPRNTYATILVPLTRSDSAISAAWCFMVMAQYGRSCPSRLTDVLEGCTNSFKNSRYNEHKEIWLTDESKCRLVTFLNWTIDRRRSIILVVLCHKTYRLQPRPSSLLVGLGSRSAGSIGSATAHTPPPTPTAFPKVRCAACGATMKIHPPFLRPHLPTPHTLHPLAAMSKAYWLATRGNLNEQAFANLRRACPGGITTGRLHTTTAITKTEVVLRAIVRRRLKHKTPAG